MVSWGRKGFGGLFVSFWEGGKGGMLRRRKRKNKVMKRMFFTRVCVWIDGWMDGWISITYEAKEKSAQ